MEIANNLIPTLSAADSPSQLSEGNPLAKNAKKKSATDETSFDGALLATLAAQPKQPGQGDAGLLEKLNQQAATKVELSTKTAAQAETGGAPAPTIASLFQAKAQQDANGTMAGAFVAGPDQPWNSRWVFGADKLPQPEDLKSGAVPGGKLNPNATMPKIDMEQLKALVAQAQGGDESQVKQAAESTLQGLDSAIAALGGELESVRTDVPQAGQKGQLNSLGGAEFISALQGAKAASLGEQSGQMAGGFGGQAGGNAGSDAASELMMNGVAGAGSTKVAKSTLSGKPALQVLPGGLSSGPSLEGGLKLSKEEPQLSQADGVAGVVPLTAAIRTSDQNTAIPPQMLTGHVVPGSMMRDRLTSESVRNMANGIQNLNPAGGGEMRIRLNPGNLGELMIKVSTNGKDVGLKVQASDNGAKKIIEESITALRESLAGQSLNLGRVDVTIATANANAQNADNNSQSLPQHSQQGMNAFDAQAGMQDRSNGRPTGNEENSGTDRGVDRSSSRATASRLALAAQAGSAGRASSSSRLDVMA